MPGRTESKPRLSLTAWILALAVTPILVASVWTAIVLALHPENENDRFAAAALMSVAPAVEQILATEGDGLQRLGLAIAQNPKFFAVLTLPRSERAKPDFKNALESVLREFQRDVDTPIFAVTDEQGDLLDRALKPATDMTDLSDSPIVVSAINGRKARGYMVEKGKVYRMAAVPVKNGGATVGTLCLGRAVDEDLLGRLKTAMGSDVAFTVGDEIKVSTLSHSPLRKVLAQRVGEGSLVVTHRAKSRRAAKPPSDEPDVLVAAGERFLALRGEIEEPSLGGTPGYVLVRRLTSDSSPLAAIRRDLLSAAGTGLLLALAAGAVLAFAVRHVRRKASDAHEAELARLREVDRMRSGFFASASEEVLEPSETIRTVTALIGDGALGDLSEPQEEGLLAIQRAVDTLTRTGNDLANLSLLDQHLLPLSFQSADIGSLVEDVATQMLPLVSDRRQSITISIEPDLRHPRIDAKHISKAVMNLALSAIRFSPEGGKVEVGAHHVDQGIAISVLDTGEGVPDAGQGNVLGPDSERRGLGLAVAIGIVEAHGGSIRAWNEPGSGTIITIHLPILGSATAAPPEEEEALRLAS